MAVIKGRKLKTLTGAARFAMNKILYENFREIPGRTGVGSYSDGYSDERLANQFGINKDAVARARVQITGLALKGPDPVKETKAPKGVKELEARITQIEEYLTRTTKNSLGGGFKKENHNGRTDLSDFV